MKKGSHHIKETKEKMSEALKGKPSSCGMLGKHHTEETKRKIRENSVGMLGKHHTEETRIKMSETKKGHITTEETKRKIREWNKGRKHTEETIKKMKGHPGNMLGKYHSEGTKEKMSETHKGIFKGEKNPAWRGGISFEPYGIEFDKKLKGKIKERDNNTCQLCKTAKGLAIHHIDYNKKNNEPENLITLCRSCNTKVNCQRIFWTGYFTAVQQFKFYYER